MRDQMKFSRELLYLLNIYAAFYFMYHTQEYVWMIESWAEIKIKIFADENIVDDMAITKSIAVLNHRSDVDWYVCFSLYFFSNFFSVLRIVI